MVGLRVQPAPEFQHLAEHQRKGFKGLAGLVYQPEEYADFRFDRLGGAKLQCAQTERNRLDAKPAFKQDCGDPNAQVFRLLRWSAIVIVSHDPFPIDGLWSGPWREFPLRLGPHCCCSPITAVMKNNILIVKHHCVTVNDKNDSIDLFRLVAHKEA